MEEPYLYTPSDSSTAETTVRRSRFIGIVEPLSDAELGKRRIPVIRELYSGCSHVAYAFAVGHANAQQWGMSDDGEPKGTAGRPIMDILSGAHCSNALVAVVRYFGGTKLGTGGLARAYREAARAALESCPLVRLERRLRYTLTVSYEDLDVVLRVLADYDASPETNEYGTVIRLQGSVAALLFERCSDELWRSTKGRAELNALE